MTTTSKRWLWGTALLLAACSDPADRPPIEVDAGATSDAGATDGGAPFDAPRDGGVGTPDAGGPADAGPARPEPTREGPWLVYRPGLAVGVFDLPTPSIVGDSQAWVVRVDPAHFDFQLVARGALGETTHTAPEWVTSRGLVGAINASMYREDFRTSVFYMRDGAYVNNGAWSDAAGAVFAANPRDPSLPGTQLIDRNCDDLAAIDAGYATVVQNYRMLTCAGAPAWSDRPQIYSIAAVGMDGAGRILLIHCRSPYSVHDLTVMLTGLPLDLERLMYVEGGPEASLYVELDGEPIVSRVGSYETGFWEADDNHVFWPVPNVIGFAPTRR
jgi:hypothetical protein